MGAVDVMSKVLSIVVLLVIVGLVWRLWSRQDGKGMEIDHGTRTDTDANTAGAEAAAGGVKGGEERPSEAGSGAGSEDKPGVR